MVRNSGSVFDTQRRLNINVFIFQCFTQLIRHDFTDALNVFSKTHAVFLDGNITNLGQKMVENTVLLRNVMNVHGRLKFC